MSKTLVVVESPAKAGTDREVPGRRLRRPGLEAGHIRDLPKSDLGVDIGNGFEVTYEVPADSKKHIADLRKLARRRTT